MSLIVNISSIDLSDTNKVTGITKSLNKLSSSVGNIFGGKSTKEIIKGTRCSGILQNDIALSFTNNWTGTAYQGLYQGLEALSKQTVFGVSLNAVKATYDVSNTMLNMGGMSIVGTGAASTRMYNGSSISGLSVSMKWYTPMDDTYKIAIPAILILGFPSQRKAEPTSASGTGSSNSGWIDKIPGVSDLKSVFTDITDTLSTLLSYNPPPVTLNISNSAGTDIFNLYPLVITNISFNTSRETCNGIPVVIGITVGFEFYQIKGNNGYANGDFKIAGVSALGDLQKLANQVNQ
ncbi:MAG: hypothetical protein M0R17_00550 [Candidatus Omnitrophica bacterium]|jgi:hypothetical protein|nr:hypothetical protein [Candidatus Omnitrophota bacterium]